MVRAALSRLLTCLLLVTSGAATADTPSLRPIEVQDDRVRLASLHIAVLEDPAGILTIGDVQAAWDAGRFELSPHIRLNRGTTESAFWMRLVLTNPQNAERRVTLSHDYAPTDDVRLFVATEEGRFSRAMAGDSVAREPMEPHSRLAAFDLVLPPATNVPAYLRLATTSNMSLDLSLWPPKQFEHRENRISMLYGVLFGAIAATILYLLYAGRLAREPNALLLALYLGSYGLYLAFLNGFPSLWLPSALLGWVNILHLASLGLLFGFGAMFYRRFLQLATYGPKFDRVVAGLQWLGFAIVLSPLIPLPIIGAILLLVAGLGPLLTTSYAFYMWYRRREFADVFALGWALAHFSSLAGTLRVSGVLPSTDLFIHLPALGCAVACAFFTWAIARRVARERRYAYVDYLTGLANRREFERQGNLEFDRARRYDRALSLLVVDVDHFKRINDTWGHSAGDRVLQDIGQRLQHLSRDADLAVRVGGDEFALLLIETDLEKAGVMAKRLLESQATMDVDDYSVTVSIGVAALSPDDVDFQAMLDRADAALYRAKRSGRDQVKVALASQEPASLVGS